MAKLPDFSKNLPDGWEDRSVFTFQGPESDGVAHFLILLVDRGAGDSELEEYAEEHIDMELEAMPDMKVLTGGVKTLPGEKQIYHVTYKMIAADDSVVIRRQVYSVEGGSGFVFSINFTKRSVKLLGNQVDQIIQSLVTGAPVE
ncbi:MAG: hypothetical protein GY867_03450 [bacterium]|nr:hypothetical protein [bacterium]